MGKEIDRSNFWLVRNNPIIKTGVFPYLGRQIGPQCDPEKIYNVLRPEEELFSETAISSFNLIPITVGHALLGSRAEGLVPPEEKGVDGTTGESSKRQGDKVVNDIKLYSERIKDEIQSGKKELSAGYFCDFVPESGVWNGRRYDFVQRNIAGNHIALVEKGRNGADVRVMDSAEGLMRRSRQFVCDAMDIEGSFDENPNHSPENGQFTSGGGAGKKTETGAKQETSSAPIEITGNELGDYKDITELRKKALDYYKNHLQGTSAKNPVLGEVLFSRKGKQEFKCYSANPDKLKMILAVKSILDTSRDVSTEDLHKVRKDGAILFHRVAGKVKIGTGEKSKTVNVKVLVWEDENGNKFYDLELPK